MNMQRLFAKNLGTSSVSVIRHKNINIKHHGYSINMWIFYLRAQGIHRAKYLFRKALQQRPLVLFKINSVLEFLFIYHTLEWFTMLLN